MRLNTFSGRSCSFAISAKLKTSRALAVQWSAPSKCTPDQQTEELPGTRMGLETCQSLSTAALDQSVVSFALTAAAVVESQTSQILLRATIPL